MRSPSEIIGHDAYMQLVFEGYSILPNDTIVELRECVEAAIEKPKRSPKLISKNVGEFVPMQAWILKGQVLRAIKLLNRIST